MCGPRKGVMAPPDSPRLPGTFTPWAAWVAATCTCLGLLLLQCAHIRELRLELWELQHRVGSLCGEDAGAPPRCALDPSRCQCPVLGQDASRTKRDLTSKTPRKQRQVGQRRRAFLHLHPVSTHSYDEDDKTLVKWIVGQSQGEGLQVSGETVTVTRGGLYFIYSQVLYEDPTFVMGHVIKKYRENKESSLMKCVKWMPRNNSEALNTCYTAGGHNLESGSVLELSIPRKDAGIGLLPHATFLGIYKI
ncbi:tumor necrosis factor ligand superfamily member 13 [Paramormyrops kingsleyae]|uniref:TNF superfamily member 13 n=1 Tax=Paramormyrops kingsleyae TaxID=1676925 RepID=A0A3B3RUS0_9TELE|nr:tumor necrosis factor ligand superfamily member 13-like [Paramormyrops kingsleyae]